MNFFWRQMTAAALAVATLAACATARAAKISDLLGTTATIASPEGAAVGELFYSIDSEGRRRGIVRITSVNGEVAYALVVAGKPAVGQLLQKRVAPKGAIASASPATDSSQSAKRWRAGAGLAYFTLVGYPGSDYAMGLALGGYYAFAERPTMIDVGAIFFQGGTSASTATPGGTIRQSITLDYLGIPVVAKWNLYQNSGNLFRGKAGGMLAYLVAASDSVGSSSALPAYQGSSFDALAVGGFEWAAKSGGWWAELTLNYGIVPLSASSSACNRGLILAGGASF